jgi:hypothetical protein
MAFISTNESYAEAHCFRFHPYLANDHFKSCSQILAIEKQPAQN